MDKTARLIKEKLGLGKFRLTLHAMIRTEERFVTFADIKQCGKTAKKIENQKEKDTWKVVGKDLDNRKLTVICDVENKEVFIVTIF
ncbi:DUF4258 domain-containing protein [Bdellovibrionota bacterium]